MDRGPVLSRRARIVRSLGRAAVVDSNKPLSQHRHALDRPARLPLGRGVTWRREIMADVPVIMVSPKSSAERGAVVLIHGGGYVGGSARTHLPFATRLSRRAGLEVVLVDYRLAPEAPCPAAVDDSSAVVRAAIDRWGGTHVTVAGDSAGGGCAVATVCRLRDEDHDLPNGMYLLSPWTDLSHSGESIDSRAALDPMLDAVLTRRMAAAYCHDRQLDDPVASPLFADLAGLPPIYVQVGSDEILFSDSERLVRRVQDAGGDAILDVGAGLWHVYPLTAGLTPEANRALDEAVRVIRGWRSSS